MEVEKQETNITVPELLIAPQVSEMLQVGINRVYEMARSGELKTIRLGRQIRFPRRALLAWIEEAQR